VGLSFVIAPGREMHVRPEIERAAREAQVAGGRR